MVFGDFVTADQAITWVQTDSVVPLSPADEQIVSGLVSPASEFIRTYLDRNIFATDYEEIRDCYGKGDFVFANFPVTAVLLVVVNRVTIPPVPVVIPAPPGQVSIDPFPLGPAGYVFTPTRLIIRGYYMPFERLGVTLQYTAGYQTAPADLQQCCLELIQKKFRERGHATVSNESVSGIGSRTYTISDMSPGTRTILDRYRAVAPVSAFSRVLASTQTDPATIVGAL